MAQGNQEVLLERKQAVMLGAGVVIVLILVFVLGVLFGRNIANRKALKEQSQLAQKALTPKQPKPVPSGTAETPTLAQGGTAIQQKIDQQKPPKSKLAKSESVTKETKSAEIKTKETAPAPSKSAPAIQVASYPDKASADDLVKKLKANKWPAYDEATEIPKKGTYYRVYLGPYSGKDQAAKALVIFKNKEPKYKDAFVRK